MLIGLMADVAGDGNERSYGIVNDSQKEVDGKG